MLGLLEFDPSIDFKLLLAVLLIPLIGYVLQIFLRDKLPRGDWILTGGMGIVALITVFLAAKAIAATMAGEEFFHASSDAGMQIGWFYSDIETPAMNVIAGILYDPLGAIMLAVVGVVSFCVHLFSQGYMQGDKRYAIFFANLSLFTFAMLGLVLSDNVLFLFIFWEIMGLMSYLLIGHFGHDPSQPFFHRWATWASKKAFLTTRVGDCCLFIGIFMFWDQFQILSFTGLWEAGRAAVEANGGEFPAWMTTAGLFVFGGTVGKSAQFPLHIWLPDAMAGPTPVSAMIHAATMVAAGVFLLGRMFPLLSPEVLTIVALTGSFTALFAATIGMTAFDLKAVLAWSTVSQLGFMVAAVGLGHVTAGMYHMVTHAFFKGCLFLAAGSVIHGCHHVQDMRLMGGLRRKLPVTYICMLVCTLAIAGFPLFSGFYSKDQILLAGWASVGDIDHFGGTALFALIALPVAAMMTAFYMLRLIFITFHGEYRGNMQEHMYSEMIAAEGVEGPDPNEHGPGEHGDDSHATHEPHEDPFRKNSMTQALVILAVMAVPGVAWVVHTWVGGLISIHTLYPSGIADWIGAKVPEGIFDPDSHMAHVAHRRALYLSLFVACTGILGAFYLYVMRRDLPAKITAGLGILYTTCRRRYYIDEIATACVINPCVKLAVILKWIDEKIIDGLVLLVGRVNKATGFLSAWFDRMFVDGAVNAVAHVSQASGAAFRLLQTGRIQQYATFAVGGGLLTAAWLILS